MSPEDIMPNRVARPQRMQAWWGQSYLVGAHAPPCPAYRVWPVTLYAKSWHGRFPRTGWSAMRWCYGFEEYS